MEREYIQLDDGTRLAYRQSGQGNPIVLMHGWGCTADTLGSIEKVAAESHKVYNIDFPGFGATAEPTTVWDVEDYTRMLERFTAAMGLESPALLGHSFGGRVGLLYASRNPVDRLILVDAAGVKPHRSLYRRLKGRMYKLSKVIIQLVFPRQKAGEIIRRMAERRASADYKAASPQMRKVLSKVVNEDLCHVMPQIKAPTLLIYGENDTATPVSDARKMEALIPDAGLVTFAGCGHYSFLDNPAGFAAVLRSFLSSK